MSAGIGSGGVDMTGYVRPDAAGGSLDVAHGFGGGLSVFGRGWGGAVRDPLGAWQPDYGGTAGLRWRW